METPEPVSGWELLERNDLSKWCDPKPKDMDSSGADFMKPIETRYKRCRFRSRLEARWAVYFDAIGLEWEYEKEGFEFEDGTRYLPDFWLPQVNMWAEVKPGKFSERDLHKVKELVRATKYPCIPLEGLPAERSYIPIQIGNDGDIYIGEPGFGDVMISMYHNYPVEERRFFWDTGGVLEESNFEPGHSFDDVRFAVAKARSARFEFGEKGD